MNQQDSPIEPGPPATQESGKARLGRSVSEASTSSDSSTATAILRSSDQTASNSATLGKGHPSSEPSAASATSERSVSSSQSTPSSAARVEFPPAKSQAGSNPPSATLPFLPLSAQALQARQTAGLKPPTNRTVSTARSTMSRPGNTPRAGDGKHNKGKARQSRRIASSTSASEDEFDVLSEGGFSSKAGDASTSAARKAEPDSGDDEVVGMDRGEMLIKRRMRERKKQQKEAEKKARLKAAQQTMRTPSMSRASSHAPSSRPPISTHPSYRDSSMTSAPEGTDLDVSEADEDEYMNTGRAISRPTMSPRTNTADSLASTPRSPTTFGLESSAEHARPLTGSGNAGRRVSYALSANESTDGTATPTADVFDNAPASAKPSTVAEESNAEEVEDDEQEGTVLENEEASDSSSDADSRAGDDVEYTLKDRQDAINIEHPFGLPIWKPALYKKSRTVTRNAENELHLAPSYTAERHFLPGNILWTVLFGSWLCLVCFLVSLILWIVPWGGSKYGRVLFELGGYLFWPFGRYVEGPDDSLFDEDQERPESVHHGYDDTDEETEVGDSPKSKNGSRSASNGSGKATLRANASPAAERRPLVSTNSTGTARDYGSIPPPSASRSGSETAVNDESPTGIKILDEHPDQIYNADDSFRFRALGRVCYWIAFYLIVAPLMLLVCTLCWGLVFTIPMAKLLWVLLCHLSVEPLALHFRSAPRFHLSPDASAEEAAVSAPPLKAGQLAPRHSHKVYAADIGAGRLVAPRNKVLLCTYKALGLQYYKYTVDGVNILFINLLPLILFVIFDNFVLRHIAARHPDNKLLELLAGQGMIFVLSLLSVIPLSYFIGMAVASISAQSSIGMGAVINATFGSVIEIILYSIALNEGKAELVEGSIVGSLLAGVLLMPGLSMVSGAVRRKEQRFNARSAGVTSTMLIMAIIGTLTPTLFYEIYGTFQLACDGCPPDGTSGTAWKCDRCVYVHVNPVDDPFYQNTVCNLSYFCAFILVLSYLIGLWFSLRTHASQIWQNSQAVSAPNTVPHTATSLAPLTSIVEHHGNTNRHSRVAPGDLVNKLLPHANRQSYPSESSSGRRGGSAERPISSMSTQSTPAVTPGFGSMQQQQQKASDQQRDVSRQLHLPAGLTAEEFHRAVEVVTATASALGVHPDGGQHRPATARTGTAATFDHPGSAMRRQISHVSHAREASKGATEAAHGGGEAHGGHDAPNWSRVKSASVLMGCTVLYAIIAEILVDVVDVVLDGSGIPEKFLGISLFALVPNTTEFMNAISFALNGNIALSMEIGSAYALQVCLLQIPAMVAFTYFYGRGKESVLHHAFALIIPRWDVIAILFSVFLLTYVYLEARANYYRGSILVLSYMVLIAGFYFAPATGDPEDTPLFNLASITYPLTSTLRQPTLTAFQQIQAVFYSLWS